MFNTKGLVKSRQYLKFKAQHSVWFKKVWMVEIPHVQFPGQDLVSQIYNIQIQNIYYITSQIFNIQTENFLNFLIYDRILRTIFFLFFGKTFVESGSCLALNHLHPKENHASLGLAVSEELADKQTKQTRKFTDILLLQRIDNLQQKDSIQNKHLQIIRKTNDNIWDIAFQISIFE